MVAEKKTYAPMSRGYVLHQLRRVVVAGVYDDSAGLVRGNRCRRNSPTARCTGSQQPGRHTRVVQHSMSAVRPWDRWH